MPEVTDVDISQRVGVVVIGRNEGERLKACLGSLSGLERIVYVDSGSTDGSQAFARALGVHVVELAVPPKFTAARARNAGSEALLTRFPDTELVQMVDGDCIVDPGWIAAAAGALDAELGLAAVFGRRRELHPERSIYNALCDLEWDVPVGEVAACGGDVMLRVSALRQVDGYDAAMIAGEEPDMSARMRARGWKLRRIDAAMTLHDAAILHFGQWWQRVRRAGHAFAELAARHPALDTPDYGRVMRSITLWGGLAPGLIVLSLALALLLGWQWLLLTALLVLAIVLNMIRLAARRRREGLPSRLATASGVLLMIGKLAEFTGAVEFRRNRRLGRASQLIEYKSAAQQ